MIDLSKFSNKPVSQGLEQCGMYSIYNCIGNQLRQKGVEICTPKEFNDFALKNYTGNSLKTSLSRSKILMPDGYVRVYQEHTIPNTEYYINDFEYVHYHEDFIKDALINALSLGYPLQAVVSYFPIQTYVNKQNVALMTDKEGKNINAHGVVIDGFDGEHFLVQNTVGAKRAIIMDNSVIKTARFFKISTEKQQKETLEIVEHNGKQVYLHTSTLGRKMHFNLNSEYIMRKKEQGKFLE